MFDDASMATYLLVTVIKSFFHHFIVCMASWYTEWIHPTLQGQQLDEVLKQYELLGFPGCCGSTDCVHVPWNTCPQAWGERHLFFSRYGYPSVAYSVVVDHSRRILSVTAGHHGSRNYKTIIKFDKYVQNLLFGALYPGVQFNVFNEFGATVRLSGLYLLCDGGYHKWRVLQCPNKICDQQVRIKMVEAHWISLERHRVHLLNFEAQVSCSKSTDALQCQRTCWQHHVHLLWSA